MSKRGHRSRVLFVSLLVAGGAGWIGCGSTTETEASSGGHGASSSSGEGGGSGGSGGSGGVGGGVGGTGGTGGAGGGACVPSEEVCDGIDNDCDGSIDQGLGVITCGLGACQVSVPACDGGQPGACTPLPPAPSELCEGTDDDCDGAVDENCACMNGSTQACYSGPMGTQGIGTCKAGSQTCANGSWGPCQGQVIPVAETCDGLDSDCDGPVDEGNPGGGAMCMTGLAGVCAAGMTSCVSGQVVCNQSMPASAEACDSLDNNCNGQTDEGNPGGGIACTTGFLGVCNAGTTACQNGSVSCVQDVQPSAEACDNLDNNCNGQVDEQNPGGGIACMTGLQGACAGGTTACQNGSVSCVQNTQASPEVCDTVDNDCDGQADEMNPGGGMACMTGLQGVCAAGTLNCQGGSLICQQNAQPSLEFCGDALDNNCDGQVNEGCSSCNTAVLVLSDGNINTNNLVGSALTAAGLNPSVMNGGASGYNGVPAASSYGAVLLLVGDAFDNDMPLAGQSSIVNAFNNGTTGVLFTEWSAYKPTTQPPQWTTLSQLLILNRSGNPLAFTSFEQTYALTIAHPIWMGIPVAFTTAAGAAPGAFNLGSVINGGSQIASVTASGCGGCPTPGVVVKDGASRTVQIAHSVSWNGGGGWINDPNLKLMLTNGAKWAAECL